LKAAEVKRIVVALVLALLVLPAAALSSPSIYRVVKIESAGLTGYGATKKAWAAHHVRDRNPKLVAGCCFLPKQRDGYDRYFTVQYDQGRVFSYEMHFDPPITAAKARRLILLYEAPRDAHVSRDVRKATCEQIDYRSRQLKITTGYGLMGVELSRTAVGGRYRGIVGDILVGGGIGTSLGG
jgi:hypothetical protein